VLSARMDISKRHVAMSTTAPARKVAAICFQHAHRITPHSALRRDISAFDLATCTGFFFESSEYV
jgi:hypothetical protein